MITITTPSIELFRELEEYDDGIYDHYIKPQFTRGGVVFHDLSVIHGLDTLTHGDLFAVIGAVHFVARVVSVSSGRVRAMFESEFTVHGDRERMSIVRCVANPSPPPSPESRAPSS